MIDILLSIFLKLPLKKIDLKIKNLINFSLDKMQSIDPSSEIIIPQSETYQEKSQLSKRLIQAIVDSVVIVIIFMIYAFVYFLVEPKIRFFTCDQSEFFFPYKQDTIPYWSVVLFGTFGPISFFILIELSNAKLLPFQIGSNQSLSEKRRKFIICVFHGISLFILGISINVLLTDIGKKWVHLKIPIIFFLK